MNKHWMLMSAIALVFLLTGCNRGSKKTITDFDPHASFQSFMDKTQHFPYQMNEKRREAVLASLAKLRPGLTEKAVENMIGPADIIARNHNKNGVVITRIWIYYLFRQDKLNLTPGDRIFQVTFNSKRKVVWVVLNNGGTLKMVGHPPGHARRIIQMAWTGQMVPAAN